MTLSGIQVYQGDQDSVNLQNLAHNISLQGDFALGTTSGLQAFTIKGGVYNIAINGVIHQHGSYCDVCVGEWSDQSYNDTSNVVVNLTATDGKVVKVIARYGCGLTLQGACKRDIIGSIELTAYWWIKWLARKVTGVKVGTSGPSWLP
jgi:hypothetical protein